MSTTFTPGDDLAVGPDQAQESQVVTTPANRGGRGRPQQIERGRGRGNRRGARGRAPGREEPRDAATQGQTHRPPKPRPTHFLSLSIGHHPELRTRVAALRQGLLDNLPKIPGLEDRILVSPRRLHLTLGVMNLTEVSVDANNAIDSPAQRAGGSENPEMHASSTRGAPSTKTALDFLTQLRPAIMEELGGRALRVGLKFMDIMRPDRGDLTQAHVMWAGPSYDDEHAKRLRSVSEFVHKEFKQAGLVIDERRPLKLHCTLINTSHRKGRRQPFSYADVITSAAFRSIERHVGEDALPSEEQRGKRPIPIDLGEWTVDELQICRLGSWGPEGEYVSVGKISLR